MTKQIGFPNAGSVLSVGDKVHWMHTVRSGRSWRFTTRRGIITHVTTCDCLVRLPNGRKTWVLNYELRKADQRTAVNDIFDSIAEEAA